jgi:putative ABC transport system permease protein
VHTRPPRFADALLRWILGAENGEVIAGDLEETFGRDIAPHTGRLRARAWYWRQVTSIAAARMFASPIDRTDEPTNKGTTMAAVRQDFVYALRALRKQPGFTIVALITLALGIGANVAIFSVVNAVLVKPLPFADPDRLMLVHLLAPDREAAGTFRKMIWSYPKYQVFREHQQSAESTALFTSWDWNLTGSDSPERLSGELVEGTYFHTLGVTPAVGRTFSANETRAAGSPPLALLSHRLWIRRYGQDANVIGRPIGLNGVPHTILGVLPPGFRGLTGQADIWVPVTTLSAGDLGEAWNHSYRLVARRRPNVSPDQMEAEVKLLGARVDAQYRPGGWKPGAMSQETGWGATAVPLNDERIDAITRRSVLLMLAAVVAVLLIVCVNLANLMLARGLARQREVAIRLAVGASRLRVIRQLMVESMLLAVCGALGGVAVAYGAVSGAVALMPDLRMVLPRQAPSGDLTRVGLGMLGLDATTLLFTVVITVVAAALFGLGPAWRTSRNDLASAMKSGATGALSAGTRGLTVRNLLIVGEIALALLLLTAGGLMLESVARLQATELGFKENGLLTVRLVLPGPQYDSRRGTVFFIDLLDRLARHGDVESVAYGNCAPLTGPCNGTMAQFPGRATVPFEKAPDVGVFWASPRYFETLGIRVVRGRVFTEQDRVGQPKVIVINETAARAFWGNENPIGKRIAVGQGGFGGDGAEVIGVVADVRYGAVEKSVSRDVYLPLLQSARTWGLIFVRSRTSPESLVATLRQEVRALDPDLPLVDIKTMEDRFDDATWRTRMSAWLLGTFATLALVLAVVGIYGVISQGVEQRMREIGVRMALGAARSDILRLIVSRALAISLAGVVLGIALSIPSMRLLTALLYQVSPGDPVVIATLASLLLSAVVCAGYVPARRAAKVDPLVTLRAE